MTHLKIVERMRTGLTISTVGHAALLFWGLIAFVAKPFDSAPAISMPIDVISADQFSKITKGQQDAKKADIPKPLVEKQADPTPTEAPKAKISEKKEVVAAKEEAPPPPESKPEKQDKKAEPKADPIAEALKKDEQQKKPEEKKAESKPAPTPPAPPKKPAPKFDPTKIAALLDKREAQRQAVTGATPSREASLGAPNANAQTLSQSELDALRARLAQLWNPPIGIQRPEEMIVTVRVRFKSDGTLAGPPEVMSSGRGATYESARESAIRALYRGQPFDMLRPQTYDSWKDIEINFDPREMFRG